MSPPAASVALVLYAAQRVLKGGDQDLAPVVVGDLALLDEADGRHQCLDGARKLTISRVLVLKMHS